MEPTGLAQYLIKLRDAWLNTRKTQFEPRWNANYAMINNQDPEDSEEWKLGEGEDWRSTTFIPLPKAKVFAALSMLLEVILQSGSIPFTLKAAEASAYETLPEEQQATIDEAIEGMSELIKDQLRDRKVDRRYLKHLMSLLVYGETISKYNVEPILETGFQEESVEAEGLFPEEAAELQSFVYYEAERDTPGHDYVSVWNFLFDYEDEDFRANRGQIELLQLSPYELRQKKGLPGFDDEAIDRAISENRNAKDGQGTGSLPPALRNLQERKRNMDAFEAWVRAPRTLVEDYESDQHMDVDGGLNAEETGDEVEVLAQVANQEIVRFARVEAKDRPYRRSKWEDVLDRVDGIGVPDNLKGISAALNGMVRAFEDNKKLSANVILAIKRTLLEKPNQIDEIKPGCQLDISDMAEDVRQAVLPIVIPDVGETLMSGIAMMERWGDTASMIPQILQGYVLPKQKSDTAYELSQLLEQAGKYLGRGIRNLDEGNIEPEIRDIYIYNMQDPDVPQEKKANVKVHAGGFNSFQDRIMKAQKIRELLAMVVSSELLLGEVKVTPHLRVVYEAQDFDPDEFLLSDEEKNQRAEEQAEMEAKARVQALDDLQMQKQVETRAKIAEEEAKAEFDKEKEALESQLDREEETHKADLEDTLNEHEFQREMVKTLTRGEAEKEAGDGREM